MAGRRARFEFAHHGAVRTSQIFAYHIWGWMIHLVEIRWGHRVHLSNSAGSGNCNRIGFHYLLQAHHGLHHCGHLLFQSLYVGLDLLLHLVYFTHYSSSSTRSVRAPQSAFFPFDNNDYSSGFKERMQWAMQPMKSMDVCEWCTIEVLQILCRTWGWINLDFQHGPWHLCQGETGSNKDINNPKCVWQ